MPQNIGAENGAFNTLIPQLNENADIQTALRLYHYGEGSSGTGTLNTNSLAGFLQKLTDDKVDGTPEIIPQNANLNNYTESGFYSQNTNAKAVTGSNYPLIPPNIGFAYAGLLRVINDGSTIYQEYQVSGIPTNLVYWRAFFGNLGWTPWQTFATAGHIHDDRYYSKAQSDGRYFPAIRFKSVRQPNISNNFYTISKNDEDSILLMNNGSVPHSVAIPQDVTDENLNIAVGTSIRFIQSNTGQTGFVPNAASVVLQATPGTKLRQVWSAATLVKIATNLWILYGDLEDGRTKTEQKAAIGIYVQPNEPIVGLQDGDLWFW